MGLFSKEYSTEVKKEKNHKEGVEYVQNTNDEYKELIYIPDCFEIYTILYNIINKQT